MKDPSDFFAAADKLERLAVEVETTTDIFDLSGMRCSECDNFHYLFWPQKQVYDRVVGAALRLREIAGTLRRRSDDPAFLLPTQPAGEKR